MNYAEYYNDKYRGNPFNVQLNMSTDLHDVNSIR